MTKEEIIEMVKEADLDWHKGWTLEDGEPNRFEIFAKFVAEHEREACANICETLELPEWPDKVRQPLAKAIRARGKE
jgi:hypothetical protein